MAELGKKKSSADICCAEIWWFFLILKKSENTYYWSIAKPWMLTLKKTCITLYILLYYIIFLATIGVSFFALFGPFRANVGFGVRFKNFFVTYICRQLTLICKYSHVLFFNSATLGLFCTFRALQGYLLAMGANFGVGVMFKKIFGTYQCTL